LQPSRDPLSVSTENDRKTIEYIDILCARNGNKLIMGDFSWLNINWNTWETSSNIEGKFVDCLRKNFLIQHINTPTRVRGTDTLHVLDLVMMNIQRL